MSTSAAECVNSTPPILHATTLAMWKSGGWKGVLISGPSGSGKSDLALRALASGWRLVADDRTLVWRSGGRLFGRAPQALSGLIEARGLGVMATHPLAWSELVMAVACVATREALPRVADPAVRSILEVELPCLELFAREASAPAKLAVAFASWERRFDRIEQERIKRPHPADGPVSRFAALREDV